MKSKRDTPVIFLLILLAIFLPYVAMAKHKADKYVKPAGASLVSTNLPAPGEVPRAKFGIATGIQLWGMADSAMKSEIEAVAEIGAVWIRSGVRWSSIEKKGPDADDWTHVDVMVEAVQQAHLQLIMNVTGMPTWAGKTDRKQYDIDIIDNPTAYAAFAAKLAARYKGRVNVFEMDNEPNHGKGIRMPDPALYAQALKESYTAIKKANPDAIVLIGGLGGTKDKNGDIPGDKFIKALYENGAKGYFDAVSYHAYTYPELASEDHGDRSWSHMLNARQIMVQEGDGHKKIWVTEYGAPTGGPSSTPHVTEELQAGMVVDAYKLWNTYDWGGPLCWFTFRDKGDDPLDRKDFMGLIDLKGRKKPAALIYRKLACPETDTEGGGSRR